MLEFYKKNILIVDDVKTNILFLQMLLLDEGYASVYTASSSKDAYLVLEEEKIDLILLDVVMPEQDGIEATKYIRTHAQYKNIPIIMMTADETNETLEKSFEAGANDYITKPINIINLKVRVESLFLNAHKDTIILNQNRLLAVNETVNMLAHQWRQPLSAISATLMNISFKNEMDDLGKEYLNTNLDKMSSYVQLLSSTLDEFRKITKIETKVSLHNINDTIEQSLILLKDRFESNRIEVDKIFLAENSILYFPNEMMKILIHIYNNSIEAFDRDTYKGKKIIVESTQTDKSTYISITDNAGGIEEDMLSKVFDPYVSSKNEKNGVGLGLYNCLTTLKESMNGNIKITSTGNQTVVLITIPNEFNK